MAEKTTSILRGNILFTVGAVVTFGATLAGCESRSVYLMDYQAHEQEVAAWCRSNLGVSPSSEEGQDCIRRAWPNVPLGECSVHSCAGGTEHYHPAAGYGSTYKD